MSHYIIAKLDAGRAMSDATTYLTQDLYAYLKRISLRESDILKALREKTQKMSMGAMQISPEQGQFMALLVELMGARKILEIGVFTGYSSLVMAQSLPSDGKIIACDINVEWTKIAKQFWEKAGVLSKIDLKLAPAKETLTQLIQRGEEGTFDFIFIDADKLNYSIYYELSFTLLRPRGLIVIDNVLWGGGCCK